jgi:hypothetical protein
MEMSLPNDGRLVAAIRGVAVLAAQFAGQTGASADAFAQTVEETIRTHLEQVADGSTTPVVLRLTASPLQIQIGARVIELGV